MCPRLINNASQKFFIKEGGNRSNHNEREGSVKIRVNGQGVHCYHCGLQSADWESGSSPQVCSTAAYPSPLLIAVYTVKAISKYQGYMCLCVVKKKSFNRNPVATVG